MLLVRGSANCGSTNRRLQMVMPPSTEYTLPVANADSSEARNTTIGAISSGLASRPIGWRAMNALRASTGSA